ncbi:aldehyde-activating protein [Aureimonas endophytica]|uniref:Aldehyde-activating protein n=1 Tax=Aureimonas endophytica TaxID=2027858 RepID=A0A916ZD79_9HYPH|nr:GFA family protein [Aureimonas endophytica]GGD88070.1 aldehyde-activating protein [Aureimonas endophytica]
MSETLSGGCLCGAVRFGARLAKREMGVCHCGMCRRWSGGVFMAVEVEHLDIADETKLGVYRSSDYGERVFCVVCGSSLFWRMQDGSTTVVSYQAFDRTADFSFETEIFIDEKPAAYEFANHTKKMTGAQFVAAITGGEV